MSVHLVKLSVGCDTVEDLLAWRRSTFRLEEQWILRTRQTPRRAAELVDGGSLYRVYKGFILSRQRILAVDTVDTGPDQRCEMVLSPDVILTAPVPRRAFQGWRYLDTQAAPPDSGSNLCEGSMPSDLARLLRELGAW